MNLHLRVLAATVCLLQTAGFSSAAAGLPKRPIPSNVPPDVRKKIERLYAPDALERIKACDELGKMRSKAAAALPFLKDLLSDEERVSVQTIYMEERSSVFGRPTVGRIAADAIWDIRQRAFLPLLQSRDVRARRCAAESLAERGRGVDATLLLLRAVIDKDAAIRTAAAWGLHRARHEEVVEALLKSAADGMARVRMAAAYSLGYMQPVDKQKKVVPALVRMLQSDHDKRCRASAAWSLARWKDPRANEALRRAKSDPDKHVRYIATAALDPDQGELSPRVMLALWRDAASEPLQRPRVSQPRTAPPPATARPTGKRPRRGRTISARTAAPKARPVGGKTPSSGFRLTCIMSGPNGKAALVNGRLVREGGTVNGAKVVKINSLSVELEANGQRFHVRR